MYGKFANIYHKFKPNVGNICNIPYMDPIGIFNTLCSNFFLQVVFFGLVLGYLKHLLTWYLEHKAGF